MWLMFAARRDELSPKLRCLCRGNSATGGEVSGAIERRLSGEYENVFVVLAFEEKHVASMLVAHAAQAIMFGLYERAYLSRPMLRLKEFTARASG
jgi:hypothetical protein